jgi:preprotein translocase subunit SecE
MITRLFILITSFFISLLLFFKTLLGVLCWDYVKESFKEIHSITWPSNKETLQTALIITAIVILMGIILCLIDVFFFNLIKWAANFE